MRLAACVIACAFLFPALAAAKGSLYLVPERASYEVGEVFEVTVHADTGGSLISAAEASLSFNPRALAVEQLSTEGSILGSFSTEPSFSNESGDIQFSGWTSEPYQGSDGLLVTIRFKTLRALSSNANLVAGAALALDQGSNIVESMRSGLYTVGPQRISPDPSEAVVPEEPAAEEPSPRVSVLPGPPAIEVVSPITVGDRIIVRGITEPRMRVWVRVVGPSVEGETAVMSQESGAFEYVSGEIASDGLYRVAASVEGEVGERSELSERLIVEVHPPPITARLSAASGLLSATVPFILILALVGLIVGFIVYRRTMRAHR